MLVVIRAEASGGIPGIPPYGFVVFFCLCVLKIKEQECLSVFLAERSDNPIMPAGLPAAEGILNTPRQRIIAITFM